MKIPATFMQMGKVWRVVCNKHWLDAHDADGHCCSRSNVITIQPADSDLSRGEREHTFCHELMHCVLSGAGIEAEEAQVDVAGGLLHQFIETAEGEV